MQKIKLAVLDRMIEQKCTSAEINFLISISRYQDETGRIHGVYYRDICAELGISYQKFYDMKESLIRKAIISADKKDYSDWNITILHNDFSYPKAFQEGYLSTKHAIFSNKAFLTLKANEKLLAMEFMKISYAGRGNYHIGVRKFYEKYMELFRVTKRVIQNYMKNLKKFFSIGVKDKKYWITPLRNIYANKASASDADLLHHYIGKTVCRREKILYTAQTLRDSVNLLKQYHASLWEDAMHVFMALVQEGMERVNKNVRDKRKWNRTLYPKLIHNLIKEKIYHGIR